MTKSPGGGSFMPPTEGISEVPASSDILVNVPSSELAMTFTQTFIDKYKVSELSINNLSVYKNSYGENVITWNCLDHKSEVDHFIVIASYYGISAPIGTVAKLSEIQSYRFIDEVLSYQVGKITYSLGAFLYSNNYTTFQNQTSVINQSSEPLYLFEDIVETKPALTPAGGSISKDTSNGKAPALKISAPVVSLDATSTGFSKAMSKLAAAGDAVQAVNSQYLAAPAVKTPTPKTSSGQKSASVISPVSQGGASSAPKAMPAPNNPPQTGQSPAGGAGHGGAQILGGTFNSFGGFGK